jgi:hypothetical protein
MIRADQIPDEVAWKLHDKLWKVGGPSVDEVRATIAAALNAWPGVCKSESVCGWSKWIELPIEEEQ